MVTALRKLPLEESEKKLTALTLYASGLSINKIAGLLKVSPPAVLRWIRKLGSSLCSKLQPSEGQALVMQLDEMWHYLQSKKQALNLEGL